MTTQQRAVEPSRQSIEAETSQLEREEALLLLASLEVGIRVMNPEPRHLRAVLELLAEEPKRRVH